MWVDADAFFPNDAKKVSVIDNKYEIYLAVIIAVYLKDQIIKIQF